MSDMEFDFNSIINSIILAKIKNKDERQAKLLNVFLKRGISLSDTVAILMEIGAIALEMQEGKGE
jgi:hypothetical protein